MTDTTQTPVVAYAYDPFGVKMKQIGTFDQPYQFSTKPYDLQTGLSEFGYRYYDAKVGKWMTRDPIGERGGINLYGFVGNNAVNWIDPLGLTETDPRFTDLNAEKTAYEKCVSKCLAMPLLEHLGIEAAEKWTHWNAKQSARFNIFNTGPARFTIWLKQGMKIFGWAAYGYLAYKVTQCGVECAGKNECAAK